MKFAWIKDHADQFDIKVMLKTLRASKSGYYDWIDRPLSQCAKRRQVIVEQIRKAYKDSHNIYGSPRIAVELKASGMKVCQNTVAKYMRQEGLKSKVKRPFRVRTTDSNHEHPVAMNLLDRTFSAQAPDRKWCVDITYVPTGEGWLYLAAVIDLFSRKIVGWEMADHLRAELCVNALSMAIERRRPDPGLLHHSDRGVQYACETYRSFLDRYGIEPSMSRTGDCYDNAAMESFFSTLKRELIYHEKYQTRDEARLSIFEYIEVFYNRKRRHSAIGYQSPESFEASRN